MQPKTPKLLEDIRDAAAFIRESAHGLTGNDYQRNRMLRQSIERNFEIIGEAMRRLAQHDPSTVQRIDGYQHITAFRNILAHGYDQLDHNVVWQVIQRDVLRLLSDVAALLAED